MRYDFAYAIDVFLNSIWRDYIAFAGRTSRWDFWHFCSIGAVILVLAVLPGRVMPLLDTIGYVAAAALVLPVISIGVRRMHDVNRSGWWFAVPGVNLVLAALPGALETNRFGSNPLGATLDAFA